MAVSSTTLLYALETALGGAYQKLLDAQGAVGLPGTVTGEVNKAKLAIRGGWDADYGVLPPEFLDDHTLGSLSISGWDVTVPAVNAIISGAIPANAAAGTGITLGSTATFGNSYSFSDTSDVGMGAVYIAVGPYTSSPQLKTYFSRGYAVGIYNNESLGSDYLDRLWEPPSPVPTYEVTVAKYIIEAHKGTGSVKNAQMAESAYYPPHAVDEVIQDNFSAFNTVEDAQIAKNRGSLFSPAITGLETYTKTLDAETTNFKAYWKTQGYQFTDSFRRLYSSVKGEDLSVDMAKITALTLSATCSDKLLFTPGKLEAVLTSTQGASATVSLDVYAVTPTTGKVTSTGVGVNGDISIQPVSWATATGGYVAVRDVVDSVAYWRVASYSQKNTTALTLGFITPTFAGSFIPYVSDIYSVEKKTVYFAPDAELNSALDVGTTNYLGAVFAEATGGTYPIAETTAFTIRNK